jgi:hypothetical protein
MSCGCTEPLRRGLTGETWFPLCDKVELDDGLERTIAWYRERRALEVAAR